MSDYYPNDNPLNRIEFALNMLRKDYCDGVNATNGYLLEIQKSLFEIENLIGDELKHKNKGTADA